MSELKVSIVFSIYNEEKNIPLLVDEIKQHLSVGSNDFEFIFVNDGSIDASLEALQQTVVGLDFSENLILDLSKNFGHEEALKAGISKASGDLIVCMDADLQHPLSVVPELIEVAQSGVDIVLPVRTKSKNKIRQFVSRSFFILFNKFSNESVEPYVSDFFLISKRVVAVINQQLTVQDYLLRIFLQNIGFKTSYVEYASASRLHGKSTYSYINLFKMSMKLLLNYSKFPIYLCFFTAVSFSIFSVFLIVVSFVSYMSGEPPAGYTTLVMFLSVFLSTILGFISIILYKNYVILANTRQVKAFSINQEIRL